MRRKVKKKSYNISGLSALDEQRAKAVENICIGIVAKNMGYANQTLVCNTGKELFEFISKMTYKQFRDIKKLSKIN